MVKIENRPETKHERFIRIVEARTNKAAEMIRLIGNCSSRSSYDYSDEEVKAIFSFLEKELKNAKSKFTGLDAEELKFTLH